MTRLAGVLPATYQALAIRFEDDPFLRGMLEKLTSRRLLRFSAGTYDTYNDVFKDFLLYERLPERAESQIFRIGIGPVMQAFRSLKGQNKINPDEFGQVLGRKSRGGIYNTLRELRIAGLIVKSASDWSVPDVVRHYEHQGRLGEFVRQSVLKNRIVSEFIGQLEHKGQISKQDVPRILKQHFLFVDAKNSVWDGYARTFLDWLYKLHLVDLTDSQVLPAHEDKEEIVQKLGNLNCSGRSPIISKEVFIPTRSWGVAARVLQEAQKTPLEPADLTSSDNSAVYDLMKLGALKRESSVYVPQLSMEELESKVEAMFAREPYTEYWKLL